MKILFLVLFFLLFPITSGFSQLYDTPPTLSVTLSNTSPYIYTDPEGYTVVIGEVENNSELVSVANVQLRVDFFDDIGFQPVESTSGTTILEVIPPKTKSPYVIKSTTANPAITTAEVTLQFFDQSTSKIEGLSLQSLEISNTGKVHFTGTIKNTGGAPNSDTNVYLAFYDAFSPPRIIDVKTISVGNLEINQEKSIEFNEFVSQRATGFFLFAESDISSSNIVQIKIPEPEILTTKVIISDVYVADERGKPISEIKKGTPVKIQAKSWIQMISENKETPYKFYTQIKHSGPTPYVEFLGISEGKFTGMEREFPYVTWVPENSGIFFIETFVWDQNDVPMADPGPVILIIVR